MIRIGTKLRETRLKKRLTLSDVAQDTKIKKEFLEAIEEGDYGKLPSASYAQAFVRNYASFLGLPEQETMALFRREFDEEALYRVLPQSFTSTSFSISRFKTQTGLFIIFLFLFLLIFILFQYRDAFINPRISLVSPKEAGIIRSTDVIISGKTDPENVVYIQNFPVSVDNQGNFRKVVSFFPGKVELIIKVVNRFNRETTVKRTIEVKPSS